MNIKIYQAGLKFMLCNTVKRLYGGEVYFDHSLDHGIYGRIKANVDIDQNNLKKIKDYMVTMVNENLPFSKKIVSKQEAYNFYMNKNNKEKANNILDIANVAVSMFSLEGQYNYYYTHDMPATTGSLKYFDLYYVNTNEFVLVYPYNGKMEYSFRSHIYNAFKEYETWSNNIGIDYVCDLNDIVAKGKYKDLIRKNEIKEDTNIYEISKKIIELKKKIILLAGPSSSGKTTSSRKLSLYLSSFGVNALPISLDDYFVDRAATPLGANGKPDYESINAVDIKLFSSNLNDLLQGKSVSLPIYNFTVGTHTFDKPIKLGPNDVIVVEGLHAINPELIKLLDPNVIYKVYISPFTPLGIDRHNYVSTTDNRLIRRIIRDFRTRGKSAEETILSWQSVRDGEEKNIFPYTDMVDSVLNTAYIYEIGVLKVYVEPLLACIPMTSPAYSEARRLLDEFRTFYPIPSDDIPKDNLLREFIGGSSFERIEN